MKNLMNLLKIALVDYDGTVVVAYAAKVFENILKEKDIDWQQWAAISKEGGRMKDEVTGMWTERIKDNYPIRVDIINVITALKEDGYSLVLWTDRGEEQREKTLTNLGEYVSLFDGFIFGDGQKKEHIPEGTAIIIDDSYRNQVDGIHFLKV